jgi:hypothetical protein
MSLWADLEDRSSGDTVRSEDFGKVYSGDIPDKNLLEDGKYKDQTYMIFTNGKYPYIVISIDRSLSVFAGAGIVKIDDKDGNMLSLKRSFDREHSKYTLELNGDGDFILGDHKGKVYTVETLQDIAKDIIDQILKYEDDIEKRID